MVYADYLLSTSLARTLDQKSFREWEEKKISTEECFRQYRLNNNIKGKAPVYQKELFEYWLNSLGYRRPNYD